MKQENIGPSPSYIHDQIQIALTNGHLDIADLNLLIDMHNHAFKQVIDQLNSVRRLVIPTGIDDVHHTNIKQQHLDLLTILFKICDYNVPLFVSVVDRAKVAPTTSKRGLYLYLTNLADFIDVEQKCWWKPWETKHDCRDHTRRFLNECFTL